MSAIKAWVRGVEVEEGLFDQVERLATMPFIYEHIALMPDVHRGIGCSIGTVVATKGAIIPACVSVDIGCGVSANLTNLTANDLPESLKAMRNEIEAVVPVGFNHWQQRPRRVDHAWRLLQTQLEPILAYDPVLEKVVNQERAADQVGTLGGGNHFVEVCLDEQDRVWLMLHSGSRGIGNKIGTHYIAIARKEMEHLDCQLPDRDLAYLTEGTVHYDKYTRALWWAQAYARQNREVMMIHLTAAVGAALGRVVETNQMAINVHHNYVAKESHFGEFVLITRKGAVHAGKGELVVIPGSMGQCSYIAEGLGNPESFESCSHGAGRRMSRTAGKKSISLERHAEVTAGVECRKDAGVLDESLDNYKAIDSVMAAQADLCRPLHKLRAVLVVKG